MDKMEVRIAIFISDKSRKSSISSLSYDGGAVIDSQTDELQADYEASEPGEESDNGTDQPDNVADRHDNLSPQKQQVLRQHSIIKEELQRRYNRMGERCYEEVERSNAQELVLELGSVIPRWAQMVTITEVDDALQQFASNFCIGKDG